MRNIELKSALDSITESVRYAQRIQHAILTPTKQIDKEIDRLKKS